MAPFLLPLLFSYDSAMAFVSAVDSLAVPFGSDFNSSAVFDAMAGARYVSIQSLSLAPTHTH